MANEYNRNQEEEKSSPGSYLIAIVAQLRFDTQKGGILWKIIIYNCRKASLSWNRFYGTKYESRTNVREDKDQDLDILLEYKGGAQEQQRSISIDKLTIFNHN